MSLTAPLARPGWLSLVVVADPDPAITTAALERIAALDQGADQLELIVVVPSDVAFDDGAFTVDEGRVLRLDAPAGLAAARNAGVESARGEHVAFLAIDARPDPRWLRAAVDALRADARAAGVASKVLADDGTIEFAGAAMTFTGEPVLIHAGEHASAIDDRPTSALFASEAALVLDAQAFRFVGGFDDVLSPGVEFADLGWRLWLHGFQLTYAPDSVVTGRAWRRGETDDDVERRTRGSLGTLYKNFDEEHVGSALAGALLAANRTEPGRAAVARFDEDMPALAEARARVQSARVVADYEVIPLFQVSLTGTQDAGGSVSIDDALGVGQVFSQRRRIAVVTPDVLSAQMAGPAIRAWEMAIALSREHDVRLATTQRCEISKADFSVQQVNDPQLRELEAWCDVLIFQGHVMADHPWLRTSKKPLVVDIYDPMHLEVLEQSRDLYAGARRHTTRITVEVLNEQLARGDYFLCASSKQRDFWIGQLTGIGRINPAVYDGNENLNGFITVVPFGVTDEPPNHTERVLKGVVPGIGTDDKVVLWGGGVYNWFDPLTLIRAIDGLRARVPEVRLYFMGMTHPNPNVPAMRMAYAARELADELDLTDTHVFFNEGWVDYDTRQNYLLESDVGVSTHLDHVETAFSFRTRILDYLWASLPVVATEGDSFAEIIDRDGLGITVPPGDDRALEEALFVLLTDEARRASSKTAIDAAVHELRWNRVLEPVLEFCRSPRRASDLVDPRQRAMIGDPMLQAMWGRQGWKHTVRVAIDHIRHREYNDLARKLRMRARTMLFPEAAGPGARMDLE